MNMIDDNAPDGPGDIFVVHLRDFVVAREPIYLIGSFRDAGERIHGYPHGSLLVCRLPVPLMRAAEAAFVALCQERLRSRIDIGRMHFQGDVHEIVRAACDAVQEVVGHPSELAGSGATRAAGPRVDHDKRNADLSAWLMDRITEGSSQPETTRKFVQVLIGMRGVVDPERLL